MSNSTTTALRAQVEEKQIEYQNLRYICDLSHKLDLQFKELCYRMDEMNRGYTVVAQVMNNWKGVFLAANMSENQEDSVSPTTFVKIPN
ncbi:DASH complex subunit dad2 [Basidiobolus ranarum]|uniref:DASH complex subunit DAD2 n=1 Tax=Basidiobolus ranarum TaxID=34480 RepID=A0ABR2W9I5_9FUNG